MFTISSVKFWKENLDLTRPYTIAYKTVSAVSNIFVEIELESGLTGLGACNPSKQVVGKDVEDSYLEMQQEHWQDWLVGKDIRSLNALLQTIHSPNNRQAWTVAIDIALYDLFAKGLGVPVVDYLGRAHDRLPTSITIGIKGLAETMEEAAEYVGRGFRYMKVKIGEGLAPDLERLSKLREHYGNSIHIRVDGNQGYTASELVEFWQTAQHLDLELIEQPMKAFEPTEQLPRMQAVPQEIRDKVALDESLRFEEDAHHITTLEPRPGGIFNIKLMKCRGIYPALQIARLARYRDIDLMWGCNDESIVSITAALHAAFSCPNTKFLDLDGSLDLARDVVEGGFAIENGMMRIAGGPGLGLKHIEN
ncbi:MAG: dipeptide epimerase [Bacteroidota bacterium]